MRHTLLKMTIDENLLDILEAIEHALVQGLDALVLGGHLSAGDTVGLAHAHNLVGRQGA